MVNIAELPYGWGGPQKQLAADPLAEVMRYLFETGFIDENGQLTPAAQNQVAASAFGGVPRLTLQGLMGNRTPGLKPGYNPLNSMSHDSVYGSIVSGPQSNVGKGNPVRDQTIPGPPTRDTFESQIAQQLANLARGFDVEQKKRVDPGGWSLPDYNPDTDNLLGDISAQLGKYLENYRLPGLTIGGVNGQPGSGPIFRNPLPSSEDVKGILEAAKNILPVFDEKGNIVKEPPGSPKTTDEGKTDQPPMASGGTGGEEKPTVKDDDDNNILPTLGGILAGFPQGEDMDGDLSGLPAPSGDSNFWTDLLKGFFKWDSGANAASNIGDILRGGVSSAVNFYGNEKAADALERASDKQLSFNQSVLDTLRADLDPFKQMGINAIPGLVDAAGTTPSSAEMDSRFGGLRSGQRDVDPNLNLDTGIDLERFGGLQGLQGLNIPGVSEYLSQAGKMVSGAENLSSGLPDFVQRGASGYLDTAGDLVSGARDLRGNLPGIDVDTADIQGLLTPGSDAYNAIVDEGKRDVANFSAAKGKLGSGEFVERLVRDGLLRGRGNIEAINSAIQGRELQKRASDFSQTSGARGQLFGENVASQDALSRALSTAFGMDEATAQRLFGESATMRGQRFGEATTGQDALVQAITASFGMDETSARRMLDQAMGVRQQQVGEQFGEADRRFSQSSAARDQIFRELLGEQQSEFGNLMDLNNQDFSQRQTERNQIWSELMGEDAQGFEKLLNLVTQGQSSAARQAASAIGLSPQFSDAFGMDALSSAQRSKGVTDLIDSLFGGQDYQNNYYKMLLEKNAEGR